MIWLLSLLFWVPAAQAQKSYDAEVDRLISRARSDVEPGERCEAIYGLDKIMRSDAADEALAKKLKAFAEEIGRHDPVTKVRQCAGPLSNTVDDWRNWYGPAAREALRRQERIEDRRLLVSGLTFPVVMLLVLFVGGIAVVASQIAASYLVVHGDRLLLGGARSSIALFMRHPALLALPAFNSAAVMTLLSASFWKVLHDPRLAVPGSGAVIHARALEVVYQPTTLAAVLVLFCVAMLANTAYLSAQVRAARGEDEGLLGGLADALKEAWKITLLSAAAGAALIGFDQATRAIARLLATPAGLLERFGDAALESAMMLALNTAFCAILFERKGPIGAIERSVAVLKPQWRSGLRAMTATAILRTGVLLTPVYCCGMSTLPLWMILSLPDSTSNWMLRGGFELVALGCMGLGIVFASFILSLIWLLDASFSATLYLNAVDEKPLPPSVLEVLSARAPVGRSSF